MIHIPHSISHLARLLYVRPETLGPYYVQIRERFESVGSIRDGVGGGDRRLANWGKLDKISAILKHIQENH